MPEAIVLAAQAAASYGAATGAAWAGKALAISIASSVAAGIYNQSRARRDAKRAYNESLQERYVNIKSAVSPRQLVLGTVRAGGTWIYADTYGEEDEALDCVIAFAANECDLIGYYLNDEYVPIGSWPGTKYGQAEKRWFRANSPLLGTGPVTLTLDHTPIDPPVVYGSKIDGDTTVQELIPSTITGTSLSFTIPAGTVDVEWSYFYYSAAKIRQQWKPGTASQTPTDWAGYSTPAWSADHRLQGVAHARMLFIWDESIYSDGAPEVGVVVTGKAVAGHPFHDPRTGSHPATTGNPALLAAWYMTLPRSLGGCGIPGDWIDWPSVSAAANVCDELITVRTLDGAGYEQIPRYRCDTILSGEAAPLENLNVILSAMAGRRAFTNGLYRIEAGAFRSATLTLTDDDIVGDKPISIAAYTGAEPPPNAVTARIADARQHYVETSAPMVRNDAYVSADGAERPLDLGAMPAVTDPRRANYLMGVELETRRPAFTGTLTVRAVGERIRLLDTVTLNVSNRSAYAGKTFEVLGKVDHWDGTFELTLAEIRPQTWALDPDRFTPIDPVVPSDASYLWNVAPVAGLAVTISPAQVLGDGTGPARIEITWDEHSQPYIRQGGRIELRWRRIGLGDWSGIPDVAGSATGTMFSASLAADGIYEFQARARNSVGAVSAWSSVIESASGTTVVTPSLRIMASAGAFRVSSGGVGSPASITLTPVLGGALAGPVTWTVVSGTATLAVDPLDADVRTLAFEDMATDVVTIRAEATLGGQVYGDLTSLLKVYDGAGGAGADAITAFISNEAHVLPATEDGVVTDYARSGTTIQVLEGSELLTFAASLSPGAFTVGTPVVNPSGVITVGARSGQGTATCTVANHSNMGYLNDSATITYPVTVRRADGTDVSLSLVQSITKTKPGAGGLNVALDPSTIVLPAAANGAVITYANATTTMRIFKGTVEDSANGWTFSRTLGAGVSTATLSGNVLTISAVTTAMESGYVDVTATKAGYGSITRRVVITKAKTGAQGATGDDGDPGPAGQRGSIRVVGNVASAAWSDAAANNAISSNGGGSPQHLDEVTLRTATGTWAQTRWYISGAWTPAAAYINGNMVVSGTLAAESLVVKSLTYQQIANEGINTEVIANGAVTVPVMVQNTNSLTITREVWTNLLGLTVAVGSTTAKSVLIIGQVNIFITSGGNNWWTLRLKRNGNVIRTMAIELGNNVWPVQAQIMHMEENVPSGNHWYELDVYHDIEAIGGVRNTSLIAFGGKR